ncbi:MAG: AraC family transcriptional regulator, partial [Epsilonproteobacteria bacterium]|nr:AraC family transcriptional regulator [Campylobacterota bacterium]
KKIFIKHSFSNQTFKPHFHNHYSIGLILNGTHKLNINQDRILINQNELKIINPNEIHFVEKDSSWSYINLLLDKNEVDEIVYSIYGEKEKKIIFKTKINNKTINNQFLLLYKNFNKSSFEEELIEFIENLLLNYSSYGKHCKSFNGNITKAIEFIHEHFLEDITINDIAKAASFNKYHTIKLFKKQLSLTPHQYILRLRIEEAIRLIKKSTPLTEVAYHCNFSDQSHFIKEFKKIYGVSPSYFIS